MPNKFHKLSKAGNNHLIIAADPKAGHEYAIDHGIKNPVIVLTRKGLMYRNLDVYKVHIVGTVKPGDKNSNFEDAIAYYKELSGRY